MQLFHVLLFRYMMTLRSNTLQFLALFIHRISKCATACTHHHQPVARHCTRQKRSPCSHTAGKISILKSNIEDPLHRTQQGTSSTCLRRSKVQNMMCFAPVMQQRTICQLIQLVLERRDNKSWISCS